MAVTFLADRALIWWHAVACESWATLGICTWMDFSSHITTEFPDVHHQLRNQTKLFDLCQRGSVAKYNKEFRSLMLEMRHIMLAQDILMAYLRTLKPQVQQQVMLQHLISLHDAMHATDSANSTIGFSTWNRPQHGG